ncbi:MAG: acyl-CoA thioesterase [Verrucomicrobia bacterium]|nr:acyl-CoA thioesterase [Verrucomicrobiota bacterium]
MSDRIFRHTHRVSYAECTLGNHIYYARYFDLLETARGEFFRAAGLPLLELQGRDTVFPVIEVRARFKSPARYDDLLQIELRILALEKIRLTFGCRILQQDGRLVLEATTEHVCATLAEKPKRLPEDLKTALRPYCCEREDASSMTPDV